MMYIVCVYVISLLGDCRGMIVYVTYSVCASQFLYLLAVRYRPQRAEMSGQQVPTYTGVYTIHVR